MKETKGAIGKIENKIKAAFAERFGVFCWDCKYDCEIMKAYDDEIEQKKQEQLSKEYPYLNLTEHQKRNIIANRIGSGIAENLDLKKKLAPSVLKHDFTAGKGYRLHGNNRIGKTYALTATTLQWPNTAWNYAIAQELAERLLMRDWDDNRKELSISQKIEREVIWKRPKEEGQPLFLLDDLNAGLKEEQLGALALFVDWIVRGRSIILCVASNLDETQKKAQCKASLEARRLWARIAEITELVKE